MAEAGHQLPHAVEPRGSAGDGDDRSPAGGGRFGDVLFELRFASRQADFYVVQVGGRIERTQQRVAAVPRRFGVEHDQGKRHDGCSLVPTLRVGTHFPDASRPLRSMVPVEATTDSIHESIAAAGDSQSAALSPLRNVLRTATFVGWVVALPLFRQVGNLPHGPRNR
jgi:hypothetical protein